MDLFLRVLSYLLIGIILLIVNAWFFQSLRQAFFEPALVIAPFEVSGTSDMLERSLAQMLQAKIGQLQRQLEASQRAIVTDPKVGPDAEAAARADDPRASVLLLSPVEMPTAVFEPVNIEVKVGGVEVGGLLPWLQRAIIKPRILTFTVFVQGDTAVVTGDLRAFGYFKVPDLWIETPSSPDQIATLTAYALIQRKMSEDGLGQVNALTPTEFGDLLSSLFKLAELNRQVASGRSAADGFGELLKKLEGLTEKAPDWYELIYLTASVADQSGERDRGLHQYERLGKLEADGKAADISQEVRSRVAKKLEDLSPQILSKVSASEQAFVDSMRQYAIRLGLPAPDPDVIFIAARFSGSGAIWNVKEKRYEVDPSMVNYPGINRYVALMGRFMLKHYDRCFGSGTEKLEPEISLWQELRSSLVEYIISTDQDSPGKTDQRAYQMPFFQHLQQLDADPRIEREMLRQLVLKLLDDYDCDWASLNLAEKVQTAGEDLNLGAAAIAAIKEIFTPASR